MSTLLPSPMETSTGDAYVVAAPRACDAVSGTLRCAFVVADPDLGKFADLMKQLDSIPSIPL